MKNTIFSELVYPIGVKITSKIKPTLTAMHLSIDPIRYTKDVFLTLAKACGVRLSIHLHMDRWLDTSAGTAGRSGSIILFPVWPVK